MKKFVYEYSRMTMSECPINVGGTALKFTESEDESAKPFSELIDTLTGETTSVAETIKKQNLLRVKYPILVTITSEPTEEDLQDFNYGFATLDDASSALRETEATNELELAAAKGIRNWVCLRTKGVFNLAKFADNFDTVNVDVSEADEAILNSKALSLLAVAQLKVPSTYIISTEFANKLNDASDVAAKILKGRQDHAKNVFAAEDGLTNEFVRAL